MEPKQIVAVDDSPIIVKTLEVILKNKYQFRGFTKGERALEYIKGRDIDLLILDIDMPELNGLEVLDRIRIKDNNDMPILMLTSNNDKNYVLECYKRGANDYALKPIDEESFVKKIEKLLDRFEKV